MNTYKFIDDYDASDFHHFDGLIRTNHADGYIPNVGDVVDIVNDIVGIDNTGNPYTLKAGGFFTQNVCQVTAITQDSDGNIDITLDDGTSSSPIVVIEANPANFSSANFINSALFKPYSGTVKAAGNVATAASNVVTGIGNAASGLGSAVGSIGKNFNVIIIVVVIIGAVVLWNKLGFKSMIK